MKKPIRVLIADDHPIFRRGLCSIIETEQNINIVGEAENGEIAIKIVEETSPDIAVLDIDMPIMDGVETARILQTRFPEIKTVFLTMHKDREILNALKSLQVKGYVLKDSAINDIVNCLKTVFAGKNYLSPSLTELLFEEISSEKSNHAQLLFASTLTPTEKRVLYLIAESKTTREIAEELFVSLRTIETHRYNICSKLNLKGNHTLFKFAIKNQKAIFSAISK